MVWNRGRKSATVRWDRKPKMHKEGTWDWIGDFYNLKWVRSCCQTTVYGWKVFQSWANPPWRIATGLRTCTSRGGIFKRLWSPGIDSKEWISPAYVAWRAGIITNSYSVPSPHWLFKNSSSASSSIKKPEFTETVLPNKCCLNFFMNRSILNNVKLLSLSYMHLAINVSIH